VLVLAACAGDGDTQGVLPEFLPPAGPTGVTSPASAAPDAPAATTGTRPDPGGSEPAVQSPGTAEGGVTPTGLAPSGAGGVGSTGAPTTTSGGAGGAPGAGVSGAAGAPAEQGGAAGAGGASEADPVSAGGAGVVEEPPSVSSCPPNALFCDDFEDDVAGQFPAAPWQNNTGSGASVVIDGLQAFSGEQAAHVNAPPNQAYRRGYFSLEQGSSGIFPAASHDMFGRAMMFLDATPNAVVHWTIIQAEGRAAAGTHDAYYRYGGQQQGGAGLMANYETNSGVSTDCYSHSATRMPVQRWACVEWHFNADQNEMQLWLDGTELTDMHVVDRPTTAGSGCLGNATGGEWLAPPEFSTLHLGWESYQISSNDRNLWIDDVAISTERVGCPAP
jgi:polysaccharide lyase-like protein